MENANISQKLFRNTNGFTLIELIVVIIIIAILMAALAPAIFGVIRQANRTADMSDLRNLMVAGTSAGMDTENTINPPNASEVMIQLGPNNFTGRFWLFFDPGNNMVIGGMIYNARGTTRDDPVIFGTMPDDPWSIRANNIQPYRRNLLMLNITNGILNE